VKKSGSLLGLAGFGAAVAAAAWFGSRYNPSRPKTKAWYDALDKPSWNPPNAIFPVVWTGLYALMATSAWRTWRTRPSGRRQAALVLWGAQLAVNAPWTWLFFEQQNPTGALADVVVLESLIVSYIATTWKIDRTAAVCFLPYAGWVGFASALNAEIVRRNRDAGKSLPRAA
jgi:benzodiazapine receptor